VAESEIVRHPRLVTGLRCPRCKQESLVLRRRVLASDEAKRPRVRRGCKLRGQHWLACTTEGCTFVYDLKTKININ
jgi:hypothetical protein